jgi:putative flippase GtrA
MNTRRRFVRFNAVGALGIGVQLGTIWALTDVAGGSYLPATIAGVSLAIAHNFYWHLRWTWGDRRLAGGRAVQAFLSFVAANGIVSFGGNIVIMVALVAGAGVPVLLANLMAIAVCGLVNFWLGDTIVFNPSASRTSIPTTSR